MRALNLFFAIVGCAVALTLTTHSQTGHSFGRWEGDTLVVDTAKLLPGTLFNNGVDHTENVRLLERFPLADANTLIVSQQFEDAGSFAGTAARIMSFRRGDDHVYPVRLRPDVRSRDRITPTS